MTRVERWWHVSNQRKDLSREELPGNRKVRDDDALETRASRLTDDMMVDLSCPFWGFPHSANSNNGNQWIHH